MHSLSITTLSVVVVAGALAGFGLSAGQTAILLALAIAIFGVPHGSFDNVVGRLTFQPLLGRSWRPVFYVSYLALGVVVVSGWYINPAVTCLVFFILSAWHFGLEEDYASASTSTLFGQISAIARGGVIIWSILLLRPNDCREILTQVIPGGSSAEIDAVFAGVKALAFVLIPLAAVDLLFFLSSESRARVATGLRVVCLLLLTALVNPLISFGIYFCGWHSLRGLKDLRRRVDGGFEQFIVRLLPLTVATLALGIVAFVLWSQVHPIASSLVRTTFVGLSAIAIPHLALHTCYRLMSSRSLNRNSVPGVVLCS